MTKNINKEEAARKLCVNLSVKFAERVINGNNSPEYAAGYANGAKDTIDVLLELVDEVMKEAEESDTANEEIDTEGIVAGFFRRMS